MHRQSVRWIQTNAAALKHSTSSLEVQKLPNGIRLVSYPARGPFAGIGCFTPWLGTRHETEEFRHMTYLHERTALKGSYQGKQMEEHLLDLPGQVMVATAKDMGCYSALIDYDQVGKVTQQLAEWMTFHVPNQESILDQVKQDAAYEVHVQLQSNETLMQDCVHACVYGIQGGWWKAQRTAVHDHQEETDSSIPFWQQQQKRAVLSDQGHVQWSSLAVSPSSPVLKAGLGWSPWLNEMNELDLNKLKLFRQRALDPQQMVVVGAGIELNELAALVRHSAWMNLNPLASKSPQFEAQFKGGYFEIEDASAPFTQVSLIFPSVTAQVLDRRYFATAVLGMLFGGGASFSQGGPGKGMHTRFYKLLQRYNWLEHLYAHPISYQESGLFYLHGATTPSRANDMLYVMMEALQNAASVLATPLELSRAKAMLCSQWLMAKEQRGLQLEETARQILIYGQPLSVKTLMEGIENVQADDVRQAAKALIAGENGVVVLAKKESGIKDATLRRLGLRSKSSFL